MVKVAASDHMRAVLWEAFLYLSEGDLSEETAARRMQEWAAAGCSVFMPSYRIVFYISWPY